MKFDKYIGFDLHQATTVVAILDAEGKVVMETIVATETAAIIRLLRSLSGPLHVTFEETTQARWIYDVVRGYVIAVIRRQQEWFDETEVSDPQGIGIVDATLLIETGNYKTFDKLIVVAIPLEEQKRRLRHRSGLSEGQIELRIRSQMPTEEKIKYADYIIDSSKELANTRRQVAEVNSKLRDLAASTSGKRRS